MTAPSFHGRPNATQKDWAIDRSAPGKVTGRLKRAMDAMIWQGLPRAQAAAKGPITDHALQIALKRPHVKAYYLSELEVLRLSTHARNIHVLEEIRDSTKNHMARVQAIKCLEQLCDELPTARGGYELPGLTIRIVGTTQRPMIDVTPTSESENAEGT